MITIGIIVITVIVSLMAFKDESLFYKLAFYPYAIDSNRKEYWRFVTGGFVHGSIPHLAFNMITLYFFGDAIEGTLFTETQYLVLYISALALSSFPDFADNKNNRNYIACGASGAVTAILFPLVLFQPWGIIRFNFIVPIYFIIYAVLYLVYSYYMAKRGMDNIGHRAHLWGALYGLAFTLFVHPESLRIFLNELMNAPFLHRTIL